LHELGVGPKGILRKRLTANKLADAIHQAVHDRTMAQRACTLGEAIRAEDGIGVAICLIERFMQADQPSLPVKATH
jgi:sterol 3beta-glucosyltransferase